jgi:hypothetical protein
MARGSFRLWNNRARLLDYDNSGVNAVNRKQEKSFKRAREKASLF